jgi:molybdenum cofactor guanylyltransferase
MDGSSGDVAAFILAGGQSLRMGADKAFLMLHGRTLLARALQLARSVTSNVQIVGQAAKFRAFAPVVEDVFPGCGPLGGIHAALRASSAQWDLILAVDLPFVPQSLVKFLIGKATNSEAMLTVPRVAGGFQPLCAVYRRDFADVAEKALRSGRYKIDALFDANLMQVITEEDLQTRGFSAEMFRNLNTPEELAHAAEITKSEPSSPGS